MVLCQCGRGGDSCCGQCQTQKKDCHYGAKNARRGSLFFEWVSQGRTYKPFPRRKLSPMEKKVAQKAPIGNLGGKHDLGAKLWPNGEIAIWRKKTCALRLAGPDPNPSRTDFVMAAFRCYMMSEDILRAAGSPLGLSLLPIFDKLKRGLLKGAQRIPKFRATKGSTGITAYGKRMVRNAAHLIEQESGVGRTIFATATVPSLPRKEMRKLHENWGRVVEAYRLGIRRVLKEKGLSGELVTVSEIQEQRYEKTGLPVLHIHSVFCGVTNVGRYALSIKNHDAIWLRALNGVVNIDRDKTSYSCNLQRVKKSASGYMAKYLTKGSKAVSRAIADGFGAWLPKHWWNCTRTLSKRVKRQTRDISEFADWLDTVAEGEGNHLWKWHRDVYLGNEEEGQVRMCRYGQLSPSFAALLRDYHSP